MNFERLRIFVTVAEREHVTEAARLLNLTQSAVSNALSVLEAEHSVQLFDRVGRGIRLNAVGRAFLPEARAVLARAAAAAAALADMSSLRGGRLAIFASQTIASYWLPRRLVEFNAAHPGIELNVAIGNTREATEAVLSGTAEIGLVEGEVDNPALSKSRVGADRLAVLVAAGHPWAKLSRLEASELLTQPWILREAGSGTRSTLEAALRAAGVDPRGLEITMTLPANEAVLAAAEAGAGATALSESVARASLAAGRLVAVPFPLPERPFRLIRHKERYRSRAGDAFIDVCTAIAP